MIMVVVKERRTGNVVYEVGCEGEMCAFKIEEGLNSTLNHHKYYTRVVFK